MMQVKFIIYKPQKGIPVLKKLENVLLMKCTRYLILIHVQMDPYKLINYQKKKMNIKPQKISITGKILCWLINRESKHVEFS